MIETLDDEKAELSEIFLRSPNDTEVSRPNVALEKHNNGRCKCSFCDKNIQAGKFAASVSYSSGYGGSSHKRICEQCILAYALMLLRTRNDEELDGFYPQTW